jgi:DNA-binding XRE family transcriptional regulator
VANRRIRCEPRFCSENRTQIARIRHHRVSSQQTVLDKLTAGNLLRNEVVIGGTLPFASFRKQDQNCFSNDSEFCSFDPMFRPILMSLAFSVSAFAHPPFKIAARSGIFGNSNPSWNNPFWSICQPFPMLQYMERIGGLSPKQRHERRVFLRLLRRIRLEAKLTQTDLAKLLGVTQARVSKYEQGERRMDVLELKRVCDAVGFPLIEFARQFEEGCGQYSG